MKPKHRNFSLLHPYPPSPSSSSCIFNVFLSLLLFSDSLTTLTSKYFHYFTSFLRYHLTVVFDGIRIGSVGGFCVFFSFVSRCAQHSVSHIRYFWLFFSLSLELVHVHIRNADEWWWWIRLWSSSVGTMTIVVAAVAIAAAVVAAAVIFATANIVSAYICINISTIASRRNINFYYLLNDWSDQPLHFAIVFQSPWRTWNQEQICHATIYLSMCLCNMFYIYVRYLHYSGRHYVRRVHRTRYARSDAV